MESVKTEIVNNEKRKSKDLLSEYFKLKEICEEVLLMAKSLSLQDMDINPTIKTPPLTEEQEKQLNENFSRYIEKTPEELGYQFSLKCKSIWFPN